MLTSVSVPQGTPFSDQDAALRLAQGDPDRTCGHLCPLCPDSTACQRPPGHDPEYGHRGNAGTGEYHVWRDHGRG
jgi:hypothetical protein